MTVNYKQPGSQENKLNEKPTPASFSIQLTSAQAKRWRERGRIGEEGWGRESQKLTLTRLLRHILRRTETPGNNRVWPLTFRPGVNKCKRPHTTILVNLDDMRGP